MTLDWPFSVPVLTDGELTLRAHTPADIDLMVDMGQDLESSRWTTMPTPYRREDAEQFLYDVVQPGWNDNTRQTWVIEFDLGDGPRFCGDLGLRGNGPVREIGYILHPAARGRGIMKRAVEMAIQWGFTEDGMELVRWVAEPGNIASLRVAHAVGFTLHGEIPDYNLNRAKPTPMWTATRVFGDKPQPVAPWQSSTFHTDRLKLRPFLETDLERTQEACSDPVTQQFLGTLPRGYSIDNARYFYHDLSWKAARGERITWAITDPESDQLLGCISISQLNDFQQDGEIGYWMHPDSRGKGYVTEALRGVIAQAFDSEKLNLRKLFLGAAVGNEPSNQIAVSAGFRLFGTQTEGERLGDGSYADLNYYELLRGQETGNRALGE